MDETWWHPDDVAVVPSDVDASGRLGVRGDGRIDAALSMLEGVAAAESRLFAMRAQALVAAGRGAQEVDRASGHNLTSAFLPMHLAGTLTVQQTTAQAELEAARHLVVLLPGTWAGLDAGVVRVQQARVLVQETGSASPAVCAQAEAEVLPWLADRTAGEVRRRVRAVLKRLADQAEAERARRRATAQRAVSATALPDGMTGVWATMPAGAGALFMARLRELAGRVKTADDCRTAAQRESDVLAALPGLVLEALTGGFGPAVQQALESQGFRPGGSVADLSAVLLVPAASALGSSNEPGELSGYGPVTAEHARILLQTASVRLGSVDPVTARLVGLSDTIFRLARPARSAWVVATAETRPAADESRPATDESRPATPCVASASETAEPAWRTWLRGQLTSQLTGPGVASWPPPPTETRYRPSPQLRRFVQLRDRTCVGIGCSTAAWQCDVEHRDPWPAGATSPENTSPVSRRCHRAKQSGWSYQRTRDGTTLWTAPGGRVYRRPPRQWVVPPIQPSDLR